MCGIAGVLGIDNAANILREMSQCIAHRGRDGDAVERLTDANGRRIGGLAHRRLAVLDLSEAGHQPMASGDGRYKIVFNGEIYNFRALRTQLEREGVQFRSGSDTEVVVEGWARHGERFLSFLRGMYAIAIWDGRDDELVLVRDPFGIKPLYYARRNGMLAFASEVRAVRKAGMVDGTISRQAMGAYLAVGSIPEPTVAFEGMHTLTPGTALRIGFRDGRAAAERQARFASALESPQAGALLESDMARGAASVRAALYDSVEHHMVSDVPVGLFLSGGIDSSAIVAMAAATSSRTLDTFTVVFDEGEFSEAVPAREVAALYQTNHREIKLTAADFLNALPAAFQAMDQPSLDGLNTYVVSRAVHDAGLKVVLSGLGGDELFGGYASFRRAWSARSVWNHTRVLRKVVARFLSATRATQGEKLSLLLESHDLARGAYQASRALFAGPTLAHMAGGAVDIPAEDPPEGLSLLQRVSWYELTGYMRSVLLRDSDVFSMAHHLELRVPFVDREVVRTAMSLDDRLKMEGGGKGVLLAAVRDLLPRSVWDRPKQGFTLPFAEWLRGPLADEVASALRTSSRTERVGLSSRATSDIWNRFCAGTVSWSRPWALYTLVRWAETSDTVLSDATTGRRVA